LGSRKESREKKRLGGDGKEEVRRGKERRGEEGVGRR